MYCIGVIMAVSSARMSIQLYRKFFIFSIQTLVERARLKKKLKNNCVTGLTTIDKMNKMEWIKWIKA